MKIRITDVVRQQYTPTSRKWAWHITQEFHDDTTGDVRRHLYIVDPIVIAARAAEYDIDPGDIDTILDIIICEPHMAADEYGPHQADFVYNTTASEALRAHLERVEKVKREFSLVTRGEGNDRHPLDAIRSAHRVHPELHRMFQDNAQRARRDTLHADTRVPADFDYHDEFANMMKQKKALRNGRGR